MFFIRVIRGYSFAVKQDIVPQAFAGLETLAARWRAP
jgi:hypothetical protein